MNKKYTPDEIALVLARLDRIPNTVRLSIGMGEGMTFTKDEMIDHVKTGDEVGQTIIEMHLRYIRSYNINK